MTNRAIVHARLRNSRLVGPPLADPTAVVGWFGAVQAQDVPGALWAIAQRLPAETSRTIASVGGAMDDGRILRLHALRPTWHFLVPSELRWIQALTGHRVHQVNGSLNRRIGLDDDTLRRADAVLREVLSGGRALTRDEIRRALEPIGIAINDTFVTSQVAMHAELEGLIANGPRRGKQATYMLVDDRVGPQPAPASADALRELTIRYFQSHGPALVHDMAWWSGLTVGSVREGIGLAGDAVEAAGSTGRNTGRRPVRSIRRRGSSRNLTSSCSRTMTRRSRPTATTAPRWIPRSRLRTGRTTRSEPTSSSATGSWSGVGAGTSAPGARPSGPTCSPGSAPRSSMRWRRRPGPSAVF